MNETMTSPEYQPRPLHFGDNGEFTYVTCIEAMDGANNAVNEVTIFFDSPEQSLGLTISVEDLDDLTANTDEIASVESVNSKGIITDRIDPALILNVLQLPTDRILELSELAETDQADL